MSCRSLLLLFIFFDCAIFEASAQTNEVPVEIVVDKLQYKDIKTFLEGSTEAVFKFYNQEATPANCVTDQCILLRSKQTERSVELATDTALNNKKNLKVFNINSTSEAVNLLMETYEDDKGEVCMHDKGDDFYFLTPIAIKLADLVPGVFSAPLTLTSEKDKYSAIFRVRHGIPQPTDIVQDDAADINEVTKAVTLRSLVNLAKKDSLRFQWEYKTEKEDKWLPLGNPTLKESVVFFPVRDIFKDAIKTNQTIQMRMKAMSAELQSPYSSTITLKFTPEVPKINTADVEVVSTCPNEVSGKLNIKTIRGVAESLNYYIIKGKTVEPDNFPDVVKEATRIKSGLMSPNSPLVVPKLEEGEYSIIIHNANMPVGKVFLTHRFNISKYPVLNFKTVSVVNASCVAIPNGQIQVTAEGGNPAKLTYYLDPPAGKRTVDDRSVLFSELAPGSYSVIIEDECGQHISKKNVEVLKDAADLRGTISIETLPTESQADGAVKIKLEGGSGNYNYTIVSDQNETKEKTVSKKSWIIETLTKGSYKLKVKDVSSPECTVWDTAFVLTAQAAATTTTINSTTTTTPIAVPDTSSVDDNADTSTTNINIPSRPGRRKKDDRLDFFGADTRTTLTYGTFRENAGKNDYYIIVEKSKFTMSVFDDRDSLVIVYPVVFGNKDQGDKMMEGDRKTPEGEYRITEKRPHGEWSKILSINYPTEDDYKKFNQRRKEGSVSSGARIGGNIAIHGVRKDNDFEVDRYNNWTDGCVATKNEYIDHIYKYIPEGTKVIIKK